MQKKQTRRAILKGLGGGVTLGLISSACGNAQGSGKETPGTNSSSTSPPDDSINIDSNSGNNELQDEEGLDSAQICQVMPDDVEGPFYFNPNQVRSNLRNDMDGRELNLSIQVVSVNEGCAPLENALVDVWLADPSGRYSGYETFDTVGDDFLRGVQVTDTEGRVAFQMIAPGVYPGRAAHIHVKVHYEDRTYVTSQIYFPDNFITNILSDPRYSNSAEFVRNEDDAFYDVRNECTMISQDEGIPAEAFFIVGLAR